MTAAMEAIVETGGAEETRRLGERLGALCRAGDVIGLRGELGAGKTCLVQGLAAGLGVPPEVRIQSPTFTIVAEHAGRVRLSHVDLYRLTDEAELDETGVPELLGGEGVVAVEWIDRFPALAAGDHLELVLEITGPESRRVRVRGHGPRGAALAAALASASRG